MDTSLASETLYSPPSTIISSPGTSPPKTPNDGQFSGRFPASLNPKDEMQDSESSPNEHEIQGSEDSLNEIEMKEPESPLNKHEIPDLLLNPQHPDANWHCKDPILRMFDYLELQNYGHAFGPYWIAESSLDGDIHHLFRNLAAIPGLKPALILATKFLSEAKLLPFWHALIFKEYCPVEEETEQIGWPCRRIRLDPAPLSLKDLERTKAAIVRIAKDVSVDSHSNSCFGYCWAFTKRTKRHIKNERPEGCCGTSSCVTLSPKTLELLHPDTDIPSDQRNRVAFMLAVDLCHEFAHAVYMFREPLPPLPNGSRQPPGMTEEIEPFINKDRLPELGQAWESILFGGRLSSLGTREDCKYGLGLTRWPACDTTHGKNPINGAVVPVARLGVSEPKWETLHVVPMDFVENLFNQTYWKVDVKEKGIDALRFPKKLGCRKRNYEWTDEGEGNGYASDDSERRRHPDERGIVRPRQPQLPPSPPLSELDEDDYLTDNSDSFLDDSPGYNTDDLGEDDTDTEVEWEYGFDEAESEFEYNPGDVETELESGSDDDYSIWEFTAEDPDFPMADYKAMLDWLESQLFQLNNPMPGAFPSGVDFVIEERDAKGDTGGDGIWGVGWIEETEDSEITFVFPAIEFDEDSE